MGNFSVEVRNGWLNNITSTALNLALYVGDPSQGGAEISGANYSRLEIPSTSWGTSTSGTLSNVSEIVFPKANGIWSIENVTHFAVFDAGGNLKFYDGFPADQQQPIVTNNTISFAVGDIVLSVPKQE